MSHNRLWNMSRIIKVIPLLVVTHMKSNAEYNKIPCVEWIPFVVVTIGDRDDDNTANTVINSINVGNI